MEVFLINEYLNIYFILLIIVDQHIPVFTVTCGLEKLVTSGHNELLRPPVMKVLIEFKIVVTCGHNKLW